MLVLPRHPPCWPLVEGAPRGQLRDPEDRVVMDIHRAVQRGHLEQDISLHPCPQATNLEMEAVGSIEKGSCG